MRVLALNSHPNATPLGEEVAHRVTEYMLGGSVVAAARGRGDDKVTGEKGVVPLLVRTDGSWIWSMEARYYFANHGMDIEADFVAHVLSQPPGPARAVGPEAVQRAAAAMAHR